jgi:hypothetical protein
VQSFPEWLVWFVNGDSYQVRAETEAVAVLHAVNHAVGKYGPDECPEILSVKLFDGRDAYECAILG